MSEGDEATTDVIRYVGQDSNIHLKSLKSDIISVTGVGISTTLMFLAHVAEIWSWVLAVYLLSDTV